MPMTDMKSSDPSCILSPLTFISKQAEQIGQSAVVTFDQPLHWKAMEIQMSEQNEPPLKQIVLIFGQFHTRMSFLGSIGHLMTGSGLDAILKLIYAENVLPYMLNGKAYSRAIRGHLLVAPSLYALMISQVYETPLVTRTESSDGSNVAQSYDNAVFPGLIHPDLNYLSKLINDVIIGEASANDIENDSLVWGLMNKLTHFRKIHINSKTAQLWFQYIDIISIVCKSIKAQRIGNWLLHLEALIDMLPFFAASGHYLYLKSARLYLQSMYELETTNLTVFDHFKDNGFHVIKTSDRYWGGISTDLTIEQKLVRSVKTTGGLTRGKGMGEVQRTIWLFSTPICAEIKDALRNITGVSYETSEQHKETTLSRGKQRRINYCRVCSGS